MLSCTHHARMKEGHKQFTRKDDAPLVPESYVLCRDCDGSWVDANHGACAHCDGGTTSKDFHLCLSCALREHRCQHCGEQVHLHIASC